jgi:hypothetical protein
MFDGKWYSLLSETQFAVHQTVLGVSELAGAVHPDQLFNASDADVVRHTLHNGLFAYTTGIERLAKLSLSAVSYRTTGGYPKVKQFGHKISDLLRSMEQVDTSLYSHDGYSMQYVNQGAPIPLTSKFVSLLDDYAQGSGRYEFLDSLSDPQKEPDLYERWMELSNLVEITDSVTRMCTIPQRISESLYCASRVLESRADLDTFDWLIEPYIDNFLKDRLHDASVEVALIYYELVRWVAAHLSAVSAQIFYHDPRDGKMPSFPYLPEVIDRHLLLDRDLFIQVHILNLNDISSTLEGINDAARAYDMLYE